MDTLEFNDQYTYETVFANFETFWQVNLPSKHLSVQILQ